MATARGTTSCPANRRCRCSTSSGSTSSGSPLNPFAYQQTVEDPLLLFGEDPPDHELRHGIREARRLGLKVMLKPHVWVRQQSTREWRGTIGQDSEEGWRQWWEHYESFILHYARLAAQEEVEIFCIGVELSRAARERPKDWRRLIARVRKAYPGPLTYAANWWEEYDLLEFWRALDYIGINAFFPLSKVPNPSLEQLRRRGREGGGRDREVPPVHGASGAADGGRVPVRARRQPQALGVDAGRVAPVDGGTGPAATGWCWRRSGSGPGSTACTGGSGTPTTSRATRSGTRPGASPRRKVLREWYQRSGPVPAPEARPTR